PLLIMRNEEPIIHLDPELAVAESDVHVIGGDMLVGTSLWKDAWRRLLKNRLAVVGIAIVIVIALASLSGPSIIKRATGFTPDYIPSDVTLLKSFPPFTGPSGGFSWTHPMGTDNQGRDILARVLQGGQISLMVGIISTIVSLLIGVTYGAISGYVGGRV